MLIRGLLLLTTSILFLSDGFGQGFFTQDFVENFEDDEIITLRVSVTGLPEKMDTLSFGLESVCIMNAFSVEDFLKITLISPGGKELKLMDIKKPTGLDLAGICFVNDSTSATNQTAVNDYSGNYKPVFSPANFNDGSNPNGEWRLLLETTSLTETFEESIFWGLNFGPNPLKPEIVRRSTLPAFYIETKGKQIIQEPKIKCSIKVKAIVGGKDSLLFEHLAGIEYRGSASKSYLQKSYGITFWDSTGSEQNVAFLNLPGESDWVLNNFFRDHSLLRNPFVYSLWGQMGHYSPKGKYCEVFVNGIYTGLGFIMEKVKQGSNRIDIDRLDFKDTIPPIQNGGFIVKIDKTNGSDKERRISRYKPLNYDSTFNRSIGWLFHKPSERNIHQVQEAFILNYLDSFETVLTNFPNHPVDYKSMVDISSAADYFLITELVKNFDGFRSSTFLYKDKFGKLTFGPVWDNDLSIGTIAHCDAEKTSGWAANIGIGCNDEYLQVPFWWKDFLRDPEYAKLLKSRWNQLRKTILSEDKIFGLIDSLAEISSLAALSHFHQWNPFEYTWTTTESRFQKEEVSFIKNWLKERLTWMDKEVPLLKYEDFHYFRPYTPDKKSPKP